MVPGVLKSSKNSNKYLEEAQASGVLHISNKVSLILIKNLL